MPFIALLIAAVCRACCRHAAQTAFSCALDLCIDSSCTTRPRGAEIILPFELEYPASLPTDSCGATVDTDDGDAVFHFTELTVGAVV